jgi:hypothetical protein
MFSLSSAALLATLEQRFIALLALFSLKSFSVWHFIF